MREFDNKGNLILSISDNNVVMLTKDPQNSMPITKSNAEDESVVVDDEISKKSWLSD
jgi:hypothetical protein